MAAKITYEIIGDPNFLREPEYHFYIPGFLQEFEDKFKLAETVEIEFEESINPDPNNLEREKPIVTNNGKCINVHYKTNRYFKPKGIVSKPSSQDFFDGLSFYITNTVIKGDNERFRELNTNQEEE